MFAIVENGSIVKTAGSIGALFPNTSMPSVLNPTWMQEHNVQEVVEGTRQDEKFYWVTPGELSVVNGQATQTYVNTPKQLDDREEVDQAGNPLFVKVYDPTADNGKGAMVDSTERLVSKGLKSVFTAQVKDTAGKILAATDWMVIRKAERNVDIPADVVAKRAAIVAECSRLESAIAAVTTVDELAAVLNAQNWGQ